MFKKTTLQPKESVPGSSEKPALILSVGKGTLEITPRKEIPITVNTKTGKCQFRGGGHPCGQQSRLICPADHRVEFNSQGSPERWGRRGLSHHYKVLLENRLVRVYDIHIPARSNEPQHTHKDRIVVCLSGAELTHLFPDGRTEVSTLKSGDVV